jgi:hypothetical protein
MPRVFDNIESHLLPILQESLQELLNEQIFVRVILICAVGSPLIPILTTFLGAICPVVVS